MKNPLSVVRVEFGSLASFRARCPGFWVRQFVWLAVGGSRLGPLLGRILFPR